MSLRARIHGGPPLVLGHRGDSDRYAENTLAAFAGAMDAGADGVELDVHLSGDGVPVVLHDRSLRRTTGVDADVDSLDAARLVELDAGAWRGQPGLRVPRLDEALALLRERDGVAAVELKEDWAAQPRLAEQVVEVAREVGMVEAMLLLSFDHRHLAGAAAAGVPAVALCGRRPDHVSRLLAEVGAALLGPAASILDAALGAEVHAAGAAVLCWTVDDEAEVLRVCRAGCDVVVTNRPLAVVPLIRRSAAAGG